MNRLQFLDISAALIMNILVAFISYVAMTNYCGIIVGAVFVGICILKDIMMHMELKGNLVEHDEQRDILYSLGTFTIHTICAIIVFSLAIYSSKINGFSYNLELGYGKYSKEFCYEFTIPAWHWFVLLGIYTIRVIWQIIFMLTYKK